MSHISQSLIDTLEVIYARANHAANTVDTARAALRGELAIIARTARSAIEGATHEMMKSDRAL